MGYGVRVGLVVGVELYEGLAMTNDESQEIECAEPMSVCIPTTELQYIIEILKIGVRQEVVFNRDNATMAADAAELSKRQCEYAIEMLRRILRGDLD